MQWYKFALEKSILSEAQVAIKTVTNISIQTLFESSFQKYS